MSAAREYVDDEDLGEVVSPTIRAGAPDAPSGDAPKRRGRPRKGAPHVGAERAPPGVDEGTEAQDKPRKRKAGSKADPASIDKFTQFLGAAHMILATQTGAPELLLEEKEARNLATSLIELSAQYGYTISPKAAALGSVAMVSVGIYAPRMFAIAQRVSAERAQAQAAARQRQQQTPAPSQAAPGPRPAPPPPQQAAKPRPAGDPAKGPEPGPEADPIALYGAPDTSDVRMVDL